MREQALYAISFLTILTYNPHPLYYTLLIRSNYCSIRQTLEWLHVAAPVVYNSIAKLTSAMLMIIRSGIVSCSIDT